MSATGQPRGPLDGVTVLELGSTVAGPFCGRLLADFGARVVKVEAAQGDAVRTFGEQAQGRSLYAATILRNKELVALDLRTSAGRDIARRMALRVDVLLENFRPGTLERWGLGYEALSVDNPGLVMVRISGFGQDGPYSARPGYGVTCEAISGLRELTGDPDRPPPRVAVSLTDYITGLYAAFGAVMALNARARSGRGQVVDAALYESAFSFTEVHVPAYDQLGLVATRAGSRLPNNTPNNLYPTADGRHVCIAAGNPSIFRRLCTAMGQRELADDARFATPADRSRHEDALDAIVGQWTASLTVDALERALLEAEVPAARIYNMADIFADAHYRARDMLVPVEDPVLGPVIVPGIVPRLSANPGAVRWGGREVGADTRGALRDLAGLDDAHIDALERDGVVRCAPVGEHER
jgi:crotonobetainyl-CoA:carnitine CoA-transferase CaiB-like acyl-CoA transferase